MTSELKAEQSRINGAKSRGPKTAEGKARSSRNAYKHGERARRTEHLRAESLAHEHRVMRWGGSDGPETDAEEFLLNEQVAMSFEIERTRRAYLERVTRRIENADATERDAVRELGERLFFDPCGPPALFGTRERDWEKVRSSWRGLAADPDHPAKLVLELESTETGCCFLLERWVELREHPGIRGILGGFGPAARHQASGPAACRGDFRPARGRHFRGQPCHPSHGRRGLLRIARRYVAYDAREVCEGFAGAVERPGAAESAREGQADLARPGRPEHRGN